MTLTEPLTGLTSSLAGSSWPVNSSTTALVDPAPRSAPLFVCFALTLGLASPTVSQAALDAGASTVLLFTDLANATSNAIYQRLGYRPVEDRIELSFSP